MEGIQLSLFGDDEVISIPECSPVKITQLTVEAARKRKQNRPDVDVMENLFGDDEVIPIPECTPYALEIYGTPEKIAQLTVEAARKWKRSHPGMDVMEIIPPSWRTYIKAKI